MYCQLVATLWHICGEQSRAEQQTHDTLALNCQLKKPPTTKPAACGDTTQHSTAHGQYTGQPIVSKLHAPGKSHYSTDTTHVATYIYSINTVLGI